MTQSTKKEGGMASRKEFLQGMVLGLSSVGIGAFSSWGHLVESNGVQNHLDTDATGDLWQLIAPLQKNDSIGKSWIVQDLILAETGAVVLFVEHSVQKTVRQIHICAIEDTGVGIAQSNFLDLILMDGSQGTQPTDEQLGRSVMVLADRIKINERRMFEQWSQQHTLYSHTDRVLLFGPDHLV